MTVLMAAGLGWALLSLPVAVLVGRGIRAADERTEFDTSDIERYLREQAGAAQP